MFRLNYTLKKSLITLLFWGMWTQGYTQMYPQNSLYLVDLYQVNPAYAGLERSLSINFNYRDQWSGFEESPRQLYVNAHMPVYLLNGGVGLSVISDQIGTLRFSSLNLSYSRVSNIRNGLISGGVSLGYRSISLDGSKLITPDGVYQGGIMDHKDPRLQESLVSGNNLNYSLGVFIGTNSFDLGLSMDNLFLKSDQLKENTVSQYGVARFYGRLPLTWNELIFYPSLLVKTDFRVYQSDISCLVKSGNIFGGLSLRGYNPNSLDSIVILGGIRVNRNYTISYSYDLGVSAIKSVSQGAHEININYNLNKLIGLGLPPEIIFNPRNL